MIVRWTNGFWKHFDPVAYREVAIFLSEKAAREALAKS